MGERGEGGGWGGREGEAGIVPMTVRAVEGPDERLHRGASIFSPCCCRISTCTRKTVR